MNSRTELFKVAFSGCLFFIISASALFYSSVSMDLYWTFPYYDECTDEMSFNPECFKTINLAWFLKGVMDKAGCFFLCVVLLMKPKSNLWGFDLNWMWLYFFFLWVIDYVFTWESMEWRLYIDVFMITIQYTYTMYCAYLYRINKK